MPRGIEKQWCGNLFRCSLSLFVATLCERFLSWWYCIFDWVLLLVLCDFGLSRKYIKYLFGGSFCFGFSRELCRSIVAFLDLWCSFFALVWCGFFGAVLAIWLEEIHQFLYYLVWVFGICLEPPTWIENRNSLLFVICERELFRCIGVLGFESASTLYL